MKLAHLADPFATFRSPTAEAPLRLLLSGCLAGLPCGIDGTDYGMGGALGSLLKHPNVELFNFCPEDFALGTPRSMPDIHPNAHPSGHDASTGDGFAVLAGTAKVLDEHDVDLTEPMIRGANAMLEFAQQHAIELAILTDMSAACGTQVISLNSRLSDNRQYQQGVGVAAARLIQGGVPVVSQRDYQTLEKLRQLLDPQHEIDAGARDHHEGDWYRQYFSQ